MRKVFVLCLFLAVFGFLPAAEIFVEPPLEINDVPLKTALDGVFLKAGNIRCDYKDLPSLMDHMTIKLTEKTELDSLLKLMLEPRGAKFRVDTRGTYHIYIEKAGPNPVPAVMRSYPLTYTTPGTIVQQVKTLLTKTGEIAINEADNELIVTDEPAVLTRVENLLRELDNPEVRAKTIRMSLWLVEVSHNEDTFEFPAEYRPKKMFYNTPYLAALDVDEAIAYLASDTKLKVKVLNKVELLAEDGTQCLKEDVTATMQSQRDGTVSCQVSYKWNDLTVKTKFDVVNGGYCWCGGALERTDAGTKEVILLASAGIVDRAQPRARNSAGITGFTLSERAHNEVLIDWSSNLPFGANGIVRYNIYRDEKPIKEKDRSKLILSDLSDEYTSFIDSSPKEAGKRYFYAVTALNASGMEESLSSPAFITLSGSAVPVAPATGKKTKNYLLRTCTAGQVIRQISGVLTGSGIIETHPLTNELVITDVEEVFEGVEDLLKELDNFGRRGGTTVMANTSFFEYSAGSSSRPGQKEVEKFISSDTLGKYSYPCIRTENDLGRYFGRSPDNAGQKYSSFFISVEDGNEAQLKFKNATYTLTAQSQRDETLSYQYNFKDEKSNIQTKTFDESDKPIMINSACGNGKQTYNIFRGRDLARLGEVSPPASATHAGNPVLELSLVTDPLSGANNVLINWSKDLPSHPLGIYRYNIYRDSKLLTGNLKGGAVSFLDTLPKENGKTYEYAVTAVSHAGVEQEILKTYSIVYGK